MTIRYMYSKFKLAIHYMIKYIIHSWGELQSYYEIELVF